mmetsp:Transcript_159070/g.510134  ORF Transcript_159070/g.510134 Transcript_159070/m.510134 type:complete len:204 (-) Transcript_159070:2058-2669(-)
MPWTRVTKRRTQRPKTHPRCTFCYSTCLATQLLRRPSSFVRCGSKTSYCVPCSSLMLLWRRRSWDTKAAWPRRTRVIPLQWQMLPPWGRQPLQQVSACLRPCLLPAPFSSSLLHLRCLRRRRWCLGEDSREALPPQVQLLPQSGPTAGWRRCQEPWHRAHRQVASCRRCPARSLPRSRPRHRRHRPAVASVLPAWVRVEAGVG